MKMKIPLLDVALYHSHRSAFVQAFQEACHGVGFCLIKHDFGNVADRLLQESRTFFQRPLSEKESISYRNSPSFRGYMPLGVENTAGKLDSREQIEWAVEYPPKNNIGSKSSGTVPANHHAPVSSYFERLKATQNPWPTSVQPSLQEATMEFTEKACEVASILRDTLCLALELGEEEKREFLSKFEPDEEANEIAHWVIKLISYPPVVSSHQEEGDGDGHEHGAFQGVGAHTDTNFLTLVLQDSVGGLQAHSNGEWIDVPTEFGSDILVCNLGEQAQILSRGYLLATPHRVLANTHSDQSRISIPLFYNPKLSASMEPLESSTIEKLPWTRSSKEHWTRPNNSILNRVGENTFKSLARSHPQVFERHHPDLKILSDGRIIAKGSKINSRDTMLRLLDMIEGFSSSFRWMFGFLPLGRKMHILYWP